MPHARSPTVHGSAEYLGNFPTDSSPAPLPPAAAATQNAAQAHGIRVPLTSSASPPPPSFDKDGSGAFDDARVAPAPLTAGQRVFEAGVRLCGLPVARVLLTMSAVSLIALVFQNASLVLMTRYSRVGVAADKMYHTSTLVLNQEVVKCVVCVVMFAVEQRVTGAANLAQKLSTVIFQRDTLKIAVPAALFTLQNFLIFASLANLDVMTFQVLSQTKLLFAAVFSVWILDRRLSLQQWLALVLLTLGVLCAQLGQGHGGGGKGKGAKGGGGGGGGADEGGSMLVGVAACLVSGVSSSFAGVYFEKVVKMTAPSLAIRNIHLAIFGIPCAAFSMLVLDVIADKEANDRQGGFRYWRGYTPFTFALVLIHALGGLLVATVVKYADNILKGFATAIAILVSGAFAVAFWGYVPSAYFLVGCGMVVVSTVWYQVSDPPRAAHPPTSPVPTAPVLGTRVSAV
jgi:UDP-sugar transporter A1/2/3